MEIKYLSLFSGIGGFELGIQQAYESNNEHARKCKKSEQKKCSQGRERSTHQHGSLLHSRDRATALCIGYSEIDKYAIQVYEKYFKHKNYGDITKIEPEKLPSFDLLVGGFPCQSFSIAGKRLGFHDTRGTLFFDIARILAEKRPRRLVLENVKGLLSHDSGKTFQTILEVLADLGYSVEWQVLNSKNFGVPQNRERVFIIGYLGGFPERKVFPIRGGNQEVNSRSGFQEQNSATIFASQYKIARGMTLVAPVLTPDRPEKRQNGRRFKENGEPSFTLTAQDRHGIYDGTKIRRLTPLECERLQGFPDNWTSDLSDTQRYKTCGNAVTVNVIEEIFKRLST
jgi:DNA (cytosine-5)-methyltransferase 1